MDNWHEYIMYILLQYIRVGAGVCPPSLPWARPSKESTILGGPGEGVLLARFRRLPCGVAGAAACGWLA